MIFIYKYFNFDSSFQQWDTAGLFPSVSSLDQIINMPQMGAAFHITIGAIIIGKTLEYNIL